MKKRRYSDENRHLWPFTLSKAHSGWYGIVLDSGEFDGEQGDCHIKLYAFGYVLICELPRLINDYRERHEAKSWDAATIARLGRDWYENIHAQEFGFCFTGEGVLHVYFGPQTGDSQTDKNKCFFLPWRSWRYIRCSFYDSKGKHFWTERDGDRSAWEARQAVKQSLPKKYFQIEDYDGEIITATTYIEEREWRFGTGIFSWLSWFTRPKVRKDLSIEFSAEVGKQKGSWKGGTLGHSIGMLPNEDHEAAFERYCQQEFRSKEGKFRIAYLGAAPTAEASA